MAEKAEPSSEGARPATPLAGRITKSTTISELLAVCPRACEVFERHGLECPPCMGAEFETVEAGCAMHGLEADRICAELNALCDEHSPACAGECGVSEDAAM